MTRDNGVVELDDEVLELALDNERRLGLKEAISYAMPHRRLGGRLELVPIDLDEANAFVAAHHRHHDPVRGCKFVVGVARDGVVVGVAIVGRPVARMASDTWTAEVLRVCSIDVPPESNPKQPDGTPHASGAVSMLYQACWRAARAIGYRKLITYTLPEEGGG